MNTLKTMLKIMNDVAGIFILWIIIHYSAANLYSMYCAELTMIGFFKSILIAQEPHCVAMRWIIYNGGIMINSMWISIAAWITSKVLNNLIL